jgi:fibro-slime domain-containing protein
MVSWRYMHNDSLVGRRSKWTLIRQPLLVALVGYVAACGSSGGGVEVGTAGGTTAASSGGAATIVATGGAPFVITAGGAVSTGGATLAVYTTLPPAVCGNGAVEAGEACDDGNTSSDDGCTADCTAIEPNYDCSQPGPCVSKMVCGDKKIVGSETCDDGNTTADDGCSDSCQLEAGWVCPIVGAACRAAECGDGIIAGTEVCDDGTAASGDGCSSTCQLEVGWICPTAGQACTKTVCGDNVTEGSEECDDGNLIPYDGCSPTCTIEPQCANGTCTAVCGDGLRFPQEACDDANTRSGDGCSADCQVEDGYACTDTAQAPPTSLVIPILCRDFLYDGTPAESGHPAGHPDFESSAEGPCNGAATELVALQLGADGKPVFASSQGTGCHTLITSADSFNSWYHDDPLNMVVPASLTLNQQAGTNTYAFSSTSFFPLNGLGWQDAQYCSGASPATTDCQTNVLTPNTNNTPPWCSQWANQCSSYGPAPTGTGGNNFSFTSELRYPFTYQGGEVFSFTGDDDVWAFVNGTLAVDLGGIHQAVTKTVTLDAAAAQTYGLTVGGMYEIALFQAERHVTQSNYKLTLAGFDHTISVCQSICGDGIVTPDEACDLGTANNTGDYGTCSPDCTLAPYCGDGIVQDPPEQCDDIVNLATYGYNGNDKACGPNCQYVPYCGNQVVDSQFGEQCDDGNQTSHDGCEPNCMLGDACGNGRLDPGEQCDDGNTQSGDSCSQFCQIEKGPIT